MRGGARPGRIASLKPSIPTLDTRRGAPVAVPRIRGSELTRIRERIAIRDGYQCRKCGRVTVHGEVDHIVPLYSGGRESDENRWWLCPDCHRVKSEQEEKGRI
jgi:5-methylcytosine-specific restriction protein A